MSWTHSIKIVTPDRRLGRQGAVPVAGRRGEYVITLYGVQTGDTIRAVGDIDTKSGQVLAVRQGAGWTCQMKWIHGECYVVPRPANYNDLPREPRSRHYIREGDHVYPVLVEGPATGARREGRVEDWADLVAGSNSPVTPARHMPYRRMHDFNAHGQLRRRDP